MTLSTSAVAVCCCSDSRKLVEQPRVLDGDDGLGSEILQQSNLPILKRPDFLPIDENCANQLSLSEQRHGNAGSGTAKLGAWRFRSFCNEVCAVDDLPRPKHTMEKLSCGRSKRAALPLKFDILRRSANFCRKVKSLPVEAKYRPEFGPANANRMIENGLEDRLDIAA